MGLDFQDLNIYAKLWDMSRRGKYNSRQCRVLRLKQVTVEASVRARGGTDNMKRSAKAMDSTSSIHPLKHNLQKTEYLQVQKKTK